MGFNMNLKINKLYLTLILGIQYLFKTSSVVKHRENGLQMVCNGDLRVDHNGCIQKKCILCNKIQKYIQC